MTSAVTRARFDDAGVDTFDQVVIPNRPRFFCRDPFGNLIEVLAIERTVQLMPVRIGVQVRPEHLDYAELRASWVAVDEAVRTGSSTGSTSSR